MKKLAGTLFFCILTMIYSLHAEDTAVIKIDKGVMKPHQIAVYPFFDSDGSFGEQIGIIVKSDLTISGLFQAVPDNIFLQKIHNIDVPPAFQNWSVIGAQYLLVGEVKSEFGMINISFKLYDTMLARKICEYTIKGDERSFRKMAHMVSNYVYKNIVGDEGYFDTRVAYVSVARQKAGTKVYRLAIMDQDGYNHRFLTDGSAIVLTPRFSPDKNELIFFSYGEKIVKGKKQRLPGNLYRYSLDTGKVVPMFSSSVNMNYAPRYSPDGKKMIFSMTSQGASSIYQLDLGSNEIVRLTRGRCIDTSPCYSPDMKSIVFNSDRGGSQQIYIMNCDGSDVRRLSYGSMRYATPVWSSRGDWIAFTSFAKGKFYIGIMKPDGSCERLLACGYLVEGPTWSPNGRVLMFSHQDRSGVEKIHSIDITGFNHREIITPLDGIDPEWAHPQRI